MSAENEVDTIAEVADLPDGQWVQDADGDQVCLIDTHMGFPQRMAMTKGGKSMHSIEQLKYPLHLCDFNSGCEHKWGLVGEGHCRRCGQMIDSRPVFFDDEGMALFRDAAARNDRNRAPNSPEDSATKSNPTTKETP